MWRHARIGNRKRAQYRLVELPNFLLPGDVSASKRYWKQDIIKPCVKVSPQGTIHVPDGVGFGFDVDMAHLETLVVRREVLV